MRVILDLHYYFLTVNHLKFHRHVLIDVKKFETFELRISVNV
jgi:hypothetical protein